MTKEELIKSQLNIDRLTPNQWYGIIRVMDEWGKQCWTEAKKKRNQLNENGFCVNYTYDDYLKEMEAKK
jgi:hypothetical protein